MKFRLISRQGVDEGTGELPNPFAGPLMVIVWTGRTFIKDAETQAGQDPNWLETDEEWFYEALGEAIEFRQVKPPPKVAERWTSPTAIGRSVPNEVKIGYVDSVAPGYVYEANPETTTFAPVGRIEGRPSAYMDGGPIPDCDKPNQVSWIMPPVPAGDPSIAALVGQPRRRRGEPS